jgi:aryl-alcohol dehydrogenase-like predicted oxidoreductase
VFGWTIDEERSFAVLDAYAGAGGNFIDTADTYGRHGSGGAGESERIIGRWMAARRNRERMVIATKVGMSPDLHGLAAQTIRQGVEESLERLGVERIDLYYAHQDDPDTPLEETLGAFATLIAEGKISYAGASNYDAERLEQALEVSRQAGMASYVALQPQYSLMERDGYEGPLMDLCACHGIACLPYFSLARGFLTGKYRPGGSEVDSPRAGGVRDLYFNDHGFAVLEALDEVAAAHGTSVAAVSLAWLAAQPTVVAPIASATSPEQLADLLQFTSLQLSEDELQRLSDVSA